MPNLHVTDGRAYARLVQLAQLELFVAVVETGGITTAGQSLGVSQPSASRSMRALEAELGIALLERDGRSVVPTAAGTCAYESIAGMLKTWQQLQVELRRIGGRPTRITLAVPFGTARVLIPVLVRRAAESMPDVTVNVVEQATPQAMAAVDAREYAMALVYPEAEVVDIPSIATERLCAVGRSDLLGSSGDPIALADLAALPLLLSEPTWSIRRTVDAAFASRGLVPNVVREVGIADALMAFAIEGDGVTILPQSNVVRELELETLNVRPIIEPEIERTLGLARATDIPDAFAVELDDLFAASLREVNHKAGWRSAIRSG